MPVCTDSLWKKILEMTIINATKLGNIEVAYAGMKPVGVCTVENYAQTFISKLYKFNLCFQIGSPH